MPFDTFIVGNVPNDWLISTMVGEDFYIIWSKCSETHKMFLFVTKSNTIGIVTTLIMVVIIMADEVFKI